MKFYQILSWKFLKLTFGTYCKFHYKTKCIKYQKEPKPPFILLANHSHELDSFFIGYYLKHPVHFLGSDEKATIFQLVLGELVGLFYTQKGTVDIKAARNLFNYIKNGESIAFFPEGEGTWDGETDNFPLGIIKIVRKFNLPVVTVNLTGAYLTKSKWGKYSRSGKVIIQFRTISKKEIENSNDDEIFKKIKKHLYNNDIKNPILQNVKFKGRNLADGIQYLIWKCPKCSSSDTIYGKKNKIICNKCSSSWTLDGNMRITPNEKKLIDLKDWNEWQKIQIKKIINSKNTNELTRTSNVDLNIFIRNSKGLNRRKMIYKKYSKGDLILTKNELIFKPYNDKSKLHFKIHKIKYFVDCINQYLKFHYENKIFQIKFDKKNISRYIYIIKYLHI